MKVLPDQDERLPGAESGQEVGEGSAHAVAERLRREPGKAVLIGRLEGEVAQARQIRVHVGAPLALREERLELGAQGKVEVRRRRVGAEADEGRQEAARQPEAHAVGVGLGTAFDPADAGLGALAHFGDQPALAEARVAGDCYDAAASGRQAVDRLEERCELLVTPDQRRHQAGDAPRVRGIGARVLQTRDRDRLRLALDGHGRQRPEVEQQRGEAARGGAHEDLAFGGGLREARRQVDRVPHDRVLLAAVGAEASRHHRAAVDTDVHAEAHAVGGVDPGERFPHVQCRAQRALGVVLVGLRRAEERHDLVADELVHGPAVVLDDGHEEVEALIHDAADPLGVQRFRERREAREVGEHHADELALAFEGGASGCGGVVASRARSVAWALSTTPSPRTARCASRAAMACSRLSRSSCDVSTTFAPCRVARWTVSARHV